MHRTTWRHLWSVLVRFDIQPSIYWQFKLLIDCLIDSFWCFSCVVKKINWLVRSKLTSGRFTLCELLLRSSSYVLVMWSLSWRRVALRQRLFISGRVPQCVWWPVKCQRQGAQMKHNWSSCWAESSDVKFKLEVWPAGLAPYLAHKISHIQWMYMHTNRHKVGPNSV